MEGRVTAATRGDLQGCVNTPELFPCAVGSGRSDHGPRVWVAFREAERRTCVFTDAPHHGPRGGLQERLAHSGARHVTPGPIPQAPLGVCALSTLEHGHVTVVLRRSARGSSVREE